MNRPLRILLVEDEAADAALVEHQLQTSNLAYTLRQVQTEQAFALALSDSPPDLILSDYTLPGFSGSKALRLARAHDSELPFISVAGMISEDNLVTLMREGATDFVPKGDLTRLVPAIQRVMREVDQRHQKRRAEVSLRDSESRFRAIFESAGTGIAVEDLRGRIVESNRALQQMLGYSPEELQEVTRQEFTHARDHSEDQAHYKSLLSGQSDYYQVEKRFVRRDGRIIWGRLTVSMVRDATGKPQFSLAMIEDITERQRAEEVHLQYAAIVESSNDAIISATFDGVIFSWNPAAERVYGFSAPEANGHSLSIIIPPDKGEESINILERIKKGERADNFETTRVRKDGLIINVSVTASPIQDLAGKVIGVSSISRDITDRKQAEAALRDSEENYRKLVELSPDGILVECEGKYVYLNSAAVEVFGARTPGQIIGKKPTDVVHPDYHETLQEHLQKTNPTHEARLHELKLIRVNGSLVDVEATAIPFLYRGKPAFQVVVRNITERKRAEEALRKSEAGLARAQRIAHLGSWQWDLGRNSLVWSEETFRIFGMDSTHHITRELFYGCVHPEDRELVSQAVKETLTNGCPYRVDHRIILPNGEIKTVTEQAEVILDEYGKPIRMLGTVLDITERKRAENLGAAFSKLGLRLSSATTSTEAARIIADEADKLFGWDAASLVLCSNDLQTCDSVFAMDRIEGERRSLPPSARSMTPNQQMRQVLEHGAQLILRDSQESITEEKPVEKNRPKQSLSMMCVPVRNGANIIGIFAIENYSAKAYSQADLDALQALGDHCGGALERIRAESENQKLAAFPQFNPNPVLELAADGAINYFNEAAEQMAQSLGMKHPSEFLPADTPAIVHECLATGESKLRVQKQIHDRLISWSFFPVHSIGVVHCYAGDITDRHNLEAQLRQVQKMESIGQLAGGIAHDFNNILTVIHGHTSLLSMSGSLSGSALESAQQIAVAAERATNLTRQLLTFSRRQIMQPRNLDLNEAVNTMAKMLRSLLGEDITLQVNKSAGLPLVHADPGMMEQILLNLSINARDAMPKGGSLVVSTSTAVVNEAYTRQHPDATVGHYVCLTVKDSGTGIAPEVLPHIFEPFFTTKDVGKGTGLGLATVYGIVQQHHGWITAESTVNDGTTFAIFLPACAVGAKSASEHTNESAVQQGKETILVVEDETSLRKLVKSVLERYGYRVLEAASGLAALSIWENHKDAIDLLLTDMVMPEGISGRELARRVLAEKPKLKVIYSSGYSLAVVGTDMVLKEGMNFLQKPYHPRKLARAIRDCLDDKSQDRN